MIGFLLDRPISEVYGTKKSSSFLFHLSSTGPKKYDHVTGQKLRVRIGLEKGILIGDELENAIQITPDLEIGKSGPCQIFNSPSLSKEKSFSISKLEIVDLNINK